MLAQREEILLVLYNEQAHSPIQTLGIEHLTAELAVTREALWSDLDYLQERGYLAVSSHDVGGRLFHSLRLTANGIDYVEHAMRSQHRFSQSSQEAPEQGDTPAVFLSHSSLDGAFCERLVQYLHETLLSADVFYDATALQGGDKWVRSVPEEIVARPVFLVVLSPASVEAPWVKEETHLALRHTVGNPWRRIIPVLHRPCDPDQLSPLLANHQIIDCTDARETTGLMRVRVAIQAG